MGIDIEIHNWTLCKDWETVEHWVLNEMFVLNPSLKGPVICKNQRWYVKETSPPRHDMICVDIWAHRDCVSTLKTYTCSNQTKSQHWEGEMNTKSILRGFYLQMKPVRKGEISFLRLHGTTKLDSCDILCVFVVLFHWCFCCLDSFFEMGENNMHVGSGGEEDVEGVGKGKRPWSNYII